jgi:hypothetical protein
VGYITQFSPPFVILGKQMVTGLFYEKILDIEKKKKKKFFQKMGQ